MPALDYRIVLDLTQSGGQGEHAEVPEWRFFGALSLTVESDVTVAQLSSLRVLGTFQSPAWSLDIFRWTQKFFHGINQSRDNFTGTGA